MKEMNVDEKLVEALSFSNITLLNKCSNQINYLKIPSIFIVEKKSKGQGKSKFEKVPKNKAPKNEINKIQQNCRQQGIFGSQGKLQNVQRFVNSKVKINCTVLDGFQIPSSQMFQQVNSETVYKNLQGIKNFLLTTKVSHENRQSPINHWKQPYSKQKGSCNPCRDLKVENSYSYITRSVYQKANKANSKKPVNQQRSSKQNSKRNQTKISKNKFQKAKSVKNTSQIKQKTEIQKNQMYQKTYNQAQDSLALELQFIYPKKSNQRILPKQKQPDNGFLMHQKYIKNNDSYQQNNTRDTCQLAASKLQRLIQVQDNKYKEMVLKTFYKHQK